MCFWERTPFLSAVSSFEALRGEKKSSLRANRCIVNIWTNLSFNVGALVKLLADPSRTSGNRQGNALRRTNPKRVSHVASRESTFLAQSTHLTVVMVSLKQPFSFQEEGLCKCGGLMMSYVTNNVLIKRGSLQIRATTKS